MKKVIDLSQHNGTIDFEKVKNAGFNDVILRIGWIGNKNNHTKDTRFNEYYKQAKMYGFNVGVYVYSYCNSVNTLMLGALWVKEQLVNKILELPVFLDLEDEQIANIGDDVLTSQAVHFCNYFKNNTNFECGVYASKYWFTNKLDYNQIENFKIWVAEWNGKENHTCNFKVDLWQYTSKGKINGINTNVDISKCLCDCEKIDVGEITGENPQNGDDEEVRIYENGTTVEPVYADTNLTKKIGFLNPHEICECLGVFENRAIVRYKIDGNINNNYKIGFVGWLGGVH